MYQAELPKSHLKLLVARIPSLFGLIVRNLDIRYHVFGVIGGGFASCNWIADKGNSCTSIAMFRTKDDDPVRGHGACNVRVGIAVATQTVREDHCRPSLIRDRFGLEDRCVFVDRDRRVVYMAGEESVNSRIESAKVWSSCPPCRRENPRYDF